MSECLLCGTELHATTKPEHILLNCLGGRKTTTRVICSHCNGILGSSIDDALCDSVAEIRNYLNLPKGDGSPPPIIKRQDPIHGVVALLPGGVPVRRSVTFDVERSETGILVNLAVGDRDKLYDMVPHVAKRLRITEDEAWKVLKNSNPEQRSEYLSKIHRQASFGSDEAQRSMAKMCLTLLGANIGVDALNRWGIQKAVAYVNTGGHKTEVSKGFQTKSLTDGVVLQENFGPFYNALFVRTTSDGNAYGYFRLYNGLAWVFHIADGGADRDATYTLINNPQAPSIWSEEDFGARLIPTSFFAEADFSDVDEVGKEFLSRVMQTYTKTARRKMLEDAFNEIVFGELGFQLNQHLTDEEVEEIAKRVSHRVTLETFRIPATRPLKLDD